jgi:hypothetical protein
VPPLPSLGDDFRTYSRGISEDGPAPISDNQPPRPAADRAGNAVPAGSPAPR